jgi:hypothetical protein
VSVSYGPCMSSHVESAFCVMLELNHGCHLLSNFKI